jgi:hypothetical protein
MVFMKNNHKKQMVPWLVGILLVLAIVAIMAACERESRYPSELANSQQQGLSLKIVGDSESQAKATGLTVMIFELLEDGTPREPPVYEHSFPITDLSTPVIIDPPPYLEIVPPHRCHYRIEVTATLSQGEPLEAMKEFNACHPEERYVVISFDTYEPFIVPGHPIWVTQNAKEVTGVNSGGGEDGTVAVSCGGSPWSPIDAPDSDRYPLTAKLWEDGAEDGVFMGEIQVDTSIMGRFADPFWLNQETHHRTARKFRCKIYDERGTKEGFKKTIARILPKNITVDLTCDGTSGLKVRRSEGPPNLVKVEIKGLLQGVTIPENETTVTVASWTPGQKYELRGEYKPTFDPTTGQFYKNGVKASVRCPAPITISPVCLPGSTVGASASQPVAQGTAVEVLELGVPFGVSTIPAGASSGSSFACPTGVTMSIGTISPATDETGVPFIPSGTCVCLP